MINPTTVMGYVLQEKLQSPDSRESKKTVAKGTGLITAGSGSCVAL
jgi:hypothetical protein